MLWEALRWRIEALQVATISLHREAQLYEASKEVDFKEVAGILRALGDEMNEKSEKLKALLYEGKHNETARPTENPEVHESPRGPLSS